MTNFSQTPCAVSQRRQNVRQFAALLAGGVDRDPGDTIGTSLDQNSRAGTRPSQGFVIFRVLLQVTGGRAGVSTDEGAYSLQWIILF